MSKSTSILVGEEQNVFIQAQIKKGRFGSTSEALRAGIRLLEERELKIENLRAAIIKGEKSGKPTAFKTESYIATKRKK